MVWKFLPRDSAEGHPRQPRHMSPHLDGHCFPEGHQNSMVSGSVFIKFLWVCSVAVTKKVALIPWTDVFWAVIVRDEESLWSVEKIPAILSYSS